MNSQQYSSPWERWKEHPRPASEDIKQARLSICHSCEFFDKELESCNNCGCFMPEYTAVLNQSCPVHKW